MNQKKVGLALGGGAVLGAAHVGVLKAIDELGISIEYVAGTSAGALIASLFAFKNNWQKIEKIILDMNWFDISELTLSKFGLLSNEKIRDIIIDNIGDVDIDDSKIPLNIIATDICSGEKVIMKSDNLADAVKASTCIPGIFTPVEIKNKLLVDGGVVENVPLHSLKNMGAEMLIGVDLNAGHAVKKPSNIVELLLNTFDFALMSATKLQTEKENIIIKPDLSKFNVIDNAQVADLIDQGYNDSIKVLKKSFK